jgi:hypothetical protein
MQGRATPRRRGMIGRKGRRNAYRRTAAGPLPLGACRSNCGCRACHAALTTAEGPHRRSSGTDCRQGRDLPPCSGWTPRGSPAPDPPTRCQCSGVTLTGPVGDAMRQEGHCCTLAADLLEGPTRPLPGNRSTGCPVGGVNAADPFWHPCRAGVDHRERAEAGRQLTASTRTMMVFSMV